MLRYLSADRILFAFFSIFFLSHNFSIAQNKLVVKTVLLDIGRNNVDGGWYGGASPASPDANGNYWNTLD
ncbi:MAG: hypothetical protein EBT07_13210, partial [Actinobacteria bacterium]|nr:hypothetical protein [Actinomycetota bacterium]